MIIWRSLRSILQTWKFGSEFASDTSQVFHKVEHYAGQRNVQIFFAKTAMIRFLKCGKHADHGKKKKPGYIIVSIMWPSSIMVWPWHGSYVFPRQVSCHMLHFQLFCVNRSISVNDYSKIRICLLFLQCSEWNSG